VHRHCRGVVVVAAYGGSAARPRREAGGFRRSSGDEEAHPGKEGGGLVGSGLPLLLLDFAQGLCGWRRSSRLAWLDSGLDGDETAMLLLPWWGVAVCGEGLSCCAGGAAGVMAVRA